MSKTIPGTNGTLAQGRVSDMSVHMHLEGHGTFVARVDNVHRAMQLSREKLVFIVLGFYEGNYEYLGGRRRPCNGALKSHWRKTTKGQLATIVASENPDALEKYGV